MIYPFDDNDNVHIVEGQAYQFLPDSINSYLEEIKTSLTSTTDVVVILAIGYPLTLNEYLVDHLNSFANSIPNPVLFCTGALGNWAKSWQGKLTFALSNHRYFEFEAKTIWQREWRNDFAIDPNKTKKFLLASIKDYPERKFILANVINTGLLDQGYVGFSRLVITDSSPVFGSNEQHVVTIANSINHHFPLPTLDTHCDWVRMPVEARTDSYLNVVMDTFFNWEPDVLFLSEKVFNAFAYGQMFIFLGPTGTLKYLQQEGYQTFGDYIDESYDDIVDPYRRLLAVTESLIKFVSKPLEEIQEIYTNCIPRLEHNKQKLFNSNYQELMYKELDRATRLKNK